jgi:Bacteriocin-protection, YdeI or OmpD-Associated/Domain of unknown function (DUF1905)
MAYFTHRFEAAVALHPLGKIHLTVVYLASDIAALLPFDQHPRLRVEADVGGVPVKGAWQPAGGRWFLMLPKAALKQAGIAVGRVVDVAFKVLPQDDVDVPVELAAELSAKPKVRQAWAGLTAGTQRGLSHMVASAKRSDTRAKRVAQVVAVVLGEAPLPWSRK